ncbi:MAG: hypothetical protein ACI9XO_003296 [Paraglaciecola sp.]
MLPDIYDIFDSSAKFFLQISSMTLIDLLGFTGVSMILIAYFLNLTHRIEPDDLRYILLNLIGAILACAASVLMKYMPFVLLESVWTLVSLQALIQYFRNKKKEV